MAPTTINRLDIKPLKVKKTGKGNGTSKLTSPQDVLNGALLPFMEASLAHRVGGEKAAG